MLGMDGPSVMQKCTCAFLAQRMQIVVELTCESLDQIACNRNRRSPNLMKVAGKLCTCPLQNDVSLNLVDLTAEDEVKSPLLSVAATTLS